MTFNKLFKKALSSGEAVEYGVIYGGESIALIKAGRGGSCRGYGDRYVKMAERLAECGMTVICSSNPKESESYPEDKAVIEQVIRELNIERPALYLCGASNGAYQIIMLAAMLCGVKKILCINMPLMINFHRATDRLLEIGSCKKIFVYGTRDPSYPYIPMLRLRNIPECQVIEIEDADHNFTDREDELLRLSELIAN